MILGLLKVALLSATACLGCVNSSVGSYNTTDDKQVNFVADKKNAYAKTTVQGVNITLYGSDVRSGLYGNFSSSSISDEYSYDIDDESVLFIYSINDGSTDETFYPANVEVTSTSLVLWRERTVTSSGGTTRHFEDTITIDFANNMARIRTLNVTPNQLHGSVTYDLYHIDFNDSSYYVNHDLNAVGTFVSAFYSYIVNFYKFTVSADLLNSYSFVPLADYIISLGDSSSWPFVWRAYWVCTNNVSNVGLIEVTEDSIFWTDEDQILFSLTDHGNYLKGYFYNGQGELSDIPNDVTFSITNPIQYTAIKNYLDISSATYQVVDFTFYSQPNFNVLYNTVVSSLFVNEIDFTSSNAAAIKYHSRKVGTFTSNGEVFDTIRIMFSNAYGMRYHDSSSNSYLICNSQYLGYFDTMFYYNSSTGLSRAVVFCNWTSYIDSDNNVQTALTKGYRWVNVDYQKLDFTSIISVESKNFLSAFNTYTNTNGINESVSYEVPLTNTINLINFGFGGLISLLGTQLLPGLTLGTIILIPFFVTLLLFIVKLFKR